MQARTPNALPMSTCLSDEELDELDQFLTSDATADEAMPLSVLDGYLTAIVIGPTTVMPSRWMPSVWDPSGQHAPEFETIDQAQRITSLIFRHMNGIVWRLQHNPDSFDPVIDVVAYENGAHESLDGEAWSFGFMQGVALTRSEWQPVFDDPTAFGALRPIFLLGAETDELVDNEDSLTRWPDQREELTKQIPSCVAAIYRFWLPQRKADRESTIAAIPARNLAKVGRNDPCPCGGGRKFKKCCGATEASRREEAALSVDASYAKQAELEPEAHLVHSPLSQTIERGGTTVKVEIYGDGTGGWLLEVVDEFGSSTVWDDEFPTDGAALTEVLNTIDTEGIASLICDPPPGMARH
jgi:uncharacterized protein